MVDLTLYAANQQMLAQAPALDKEVVKQTLLDYVTKVKAQHYLLLNHDVRYITMFANENSYYPYPNKIMTKIFNIVDELGEIKECVANEQGALEFWVMFEGQCHMFLLFNYDRGVVQF